MLARLRPLALTLALSSACFSLELVHLKNGFTLEATSHTAEDQNLIFAVGSGTLTLPQNEISSVEAVSSPPEIAQSGKKVGAAVNVPAVLEDAARAYGIDPAFVESVARIESGLRPDAVSSKGAIGLMQLMPGTAAELQVDPNEVAGNASGGAHYLRELLLRYKGDSVLALAAYNAGPGAVQKYNGAPPFDETRRYITRVLDEYKRRLRAKPSPAAAEATLRKPSATD
jgi:soluble lytic murein transglycosylase-like protein